MGNCWTVGPNEAMVISGRLHRYLYFACCKIFSSRFSRIAKILNNLLTMQCNENKSRAIIHVIVTTPGCMS